MKHHSGCMICGEEIVYKFAYDSYRCSYCELEYKSNTVCKNGHYVCDDCHAEDAAGIIKKTCLTSESTDPLSLAIKIMQHPSISMHGPEHHFLVPAVLLTTYSNELKQTNKLKKWLFTAEHRAANVLGGFCGFYGACGAGIGTGIFASIIGDASPLSKKEWASANFMTARALNAIACNGGPRCCKRDTLIAVKQAVDYLHSEHHITLEVPENVYCDFNTNNKQCLKENCNFFNPTNYTGDEN